MSELDLPGVLRRIRRAADLSQRELAERLGVSKSGVAAAESGTRGMDARALGRAAALAGLRLALLDAQGTEVPVMDGNAVRDMGDRRFPAHLDTRYGDEHWWHDDHHYGRPRPWYTFDRAREVRDAGRRHAGTPADHQLPRPGDSPWDRAAARREAQWRARDEELRRRFEAGEFAALDLGPACTCPPSCDDLLAATGELDHAADCVCGCDVS
ncbi:helix-turn-helix domain-containing protein [Blastococcus sp. SYSU D00820]